MTDSFFQSCALIDKSPFLWVVPQVFPSGIFMGYKLDNYDQFVIKWMQDVREKKDNKRRKDKTD